MPAPMDAAPIVGLSAVTVDNTKSTPVPLNVAVQVGGTVTWSAGCSAGQVVFELIPTVGYTGAGQLIFTSDFQDNGSESFTHPGPFTGFGRWRVEEPVVDGTVSTETARIAGQ